MNARGKSGRGGEDSISVIAGKILAFDMGKPLEANEPTITPNRPLETFQQILSDAAAYDFDMAKSNPDMILPKDLPVNAEKMEEALRRIQRRQKLSPELSRIIHENADEIVGFLIQESEHHKQECLKRAEADGVEYHTVQAHNLMHGVRPLLLELQKKLLADKGPDTIRFPRA